MPFARGSESRVSIRTRIVLYVPLACGVLMLLFGPSVAELGMQVLGCPGRIGTATSGCQGLAMLPANALAPWLSAVPLTETPFLLLEQAWPLMLLWLALSVLSLWTDRHHATKDATVITEGTAIAASPEPDSFAASQAKWIQQKQAEQQADLRASQRRLLVEGGVWGALSILWIMVVAGLAIFCLAFGTPLVGGLSAEGLLRSLGCAETLQMTSNPWSGQCAFWSDRLEPYLRPWFGALLAPVWLFTQFSDVLLGWLALSLVLALLPAFRVGWQLGLRQLPPLVKAGWLILFGAALLVQLFVGMSAPPPPPAGDGGLGAVGSALEIIFAGGLLLSVILLAGLVVVILFAISLGKSFRAGRGKQGAAAAQPERNVAPVDPDAR
jgi:hypothetical protein